MTAEIGATPPAAKPPRYLKWLGSDITLGTLIAVLSVFTALSSYQGSMADSDQNKSEVEGMRVLNDANAEYLTANQEISRTTPTTTPGT